MVDRLDLVRQRVNLGDADGEVRVELVGQADAMGSIRKKSLGIAGQCQRVSLGDANLGQLFTVMQRGL